MKKKDYPALIIRNDDQQEFIQISKGVYRTKWGLMNNSIMSFPFSAFDDTKFTFYYP